METKFIAETRRFLGMLFSLQAIACAMLLGMGTQGLSQGVSLNLGRSQITNVNDVISNWSPKQHLYVKGELDIGQPQLAGLQSWLEQNAPHWTVVLMRNARGESYTSLDRRQFTGMDAVEYALGRGLALRTGFSELRDPRTGETDGAVFVLFLDERKFSYYASVAQDVRSLGESHWVGELDRPAFRAMRGGGRILDAVKDTVTNINSRLSQKINAEKEQAAREERARQRAVVNINTDIAALRTSIEQANRKASAVKRSYPEATGELISPPTEQWQRQLDEVQGMLSAENVPKTTEQFNEISHEVEGYLNSYAEYETFDAVVVPIETGIDELKSNQLSVGRPMAEEATAHVASARAAREKGDRGISGMLNKAKDAVRSGRESIANEMARIKRDDARRNLIWKTIMATAALLTLAFVGVLAWLNRRRIPAMKRAHEAFAGQEEKVNAEMEKVYELFDRTGEILGDKEKLHIRGYSGTTDKLSGNAFEDIDDLFVMSSEVERVMSEAKGMIHPEGIGGKISNMFTGSKYEQGVNHISGKPLKFHRDKGLPLVIQRESERSGDEIPEEVTMTFDKVFEAFHERTATAEDTLGTIENSLMQVDDNLKTLQSQIETASEIDKELAEAADDDGMLSLPALFETLIPAAQADVDEADEIAMSDPVQATHVQIPRGSQKISDGLSIARTVQKARKTVFPELNQFAPLLQELEYNTNWIQQRVAQLGEQANGLLQMAVERSVAEEAKQFEDDINALGQQAKRAVELARDLKTNAAPSLDELHASAAAARKQISEKLGKKPAECLHEYEADPDLNEARGRKLLAAAQAALQHGGVGASTQAQDKLNAEVTHGHMLIDKSIEVLGAFDGNLLKAKQRHDDVMDKVPRHEQLLDDIRSKYAKSALVLQVGDPSYEDPSATLETHLDGCRDSLNDAHALMQQAGERFREAKLIEADEILTMAEGHISDADQRLDEIDLHCSRLAAVSRENEGKLSSMENEAVGFGTLARDRRTMRPTIQAYDRLLSEVQAAQREVQKTTPRDPFQDSAAIDAFAENVANMKAQIEADHDAHAEATRAVDGAQKERQIAEQLVNQARQDGIPDSPTTTQNIQAIRSHDQDISKVATELNGEHNDWKQVDQTAAKIHGQLGVEAGRLRGELQRAQRLVSIFQGASDAVFEATRWTGGFGSRIFGSPGSGELERARQALNRGDYVAMAELARSAQIAATHAIQRAQREVYRRQREQARREEEARRRRRRSAMNSGGGFGGMSGGIGRSSGGSRSSSGGGRSSGGGGSRSSGSGFSRSGW